MSRVFPNRTASAMRVPRVTMATGSKVLASKKAT